MDVSCPGGTENPSSNIEGAVPNGWIWTRIPAACVTNGMYSLCWMFKISFNPKCQNMDNDCLVRVCWCDLQTHFNIQPYWQHSAIIYDISRTVNNLGHTRSQRCFFLPSIREMFSSGYGIGSNNQKPGFDHRECHDGLSLQHYGI